MHRAAHSSSRVRRLRLAAAVLLLSTGWPAVACSVSVAPLVFGPIDPLQGSDSDSATSIAIDCGGAMTYSIALSTGSGTMLEREMTSGDNTLAYNLYTDASRNLIWGDGSAGTVLVDGADPGTGSSHTIHAAIPSQPLAVPGSYGDSIVVTVSF
jgi:spore coat protein U-like protein